MGVSPSAPREETHAPARSRMLLVILAYAGNGEAEDCVELGPVGAWVSPARGWCFLALSWPAASQGCNPKARAILNSSASARGWTHAVGMNYKKDKVDLLVMARNPEENLRLAGLYRFVAASCRLDSRGSRNKH